MSKKFSNLFDNDYIRIHNSILKYGLICIFLGSILFVSLFFYKKEYRYENAINFISEKEACLIVDSYIKDKIINGNKIELNAVWYDYEVLKVEESTMYLVYIQFKMDVVVNTNKYSVKLGDESLYKYIVRIMKGV